MNLTHKALASITIVALLVVLVFVSALGTYFVVGQKQVASTLITTATTTATATIVQIRDSTETTTKTTTEIVINTSTFTTELTLYQPCENAVWNGSSKIPSGFIPVLLMQPNATAYYCVLYQSAWQGNQSTYDSFYSSMNGTYLFGDNYSIWSFKCSLPNGTGICWGNASNSFKITVLPDSVKLSANLDYVMVVYIVTSLSNSTGFYDETLPWTGCGLLPMAVGYSPSQVNTSDFFTHVCPVPISYTFYPVAEYSTGMNITYVNFTQP